MDVEHNNYYYITKGKNNIKNIKYFKCCCTRIHVHYIRINIWYLTYNRIYY